MLYIMAADRLILLMSDCCCRECGLPVVELVKKGSVSVRMIFVAAQLNAPKLFFWMDPCHVSEPPSRQSTVGLCQPDRASA